MDVNEIKAILEKHTKWVYGISGGVRADISRVNFHGANLYDMDLRGLDLRGIDLSYVNLSGSNLSGSILRGVNLDGADLRGSILYAADLSHASFNKTDLNGVDLSHANLYSADFSKAKNVPFIPMTCPDTGEYIAYKKACGIIIVLRIPADAKRSSGTTRKCRASKAEVLRFEDTKGNLIESVSKIPSDFDKNFVYKIGKIVEVPDFDTNRFNECAPGIHHFINRQEAVLY